MGFEAMRWTVGPVWAGQPVVLRTEGHQHLGYIRLVGCSFRRWLAAGERGGISPNELTFRNPRDRELWGNSYALQLGLALLDAHRHPDGGHGWLAGSWEDPACPDIAALLEDALAELQEPAPLPPGPAPLRQESPPAPRRAWTVRELNAMRAQASGADGVIEALAVPIEGD